MDCDGFSDGLVSSEDLKQEFFGSVASKDSITIYTLNIINTILFLKISIVAVAEVFSSL